MSVEATPSTRMAAGPLTPGGLERAVVDGTLERIHRAVPATMGATVALTALLALDPSRPGPGPGAMLGWWSAGLAVAVLRAWQARRFLATPRARRELAHAWWERRLVAGVAASALVWAVGVVLLADGSNVSQRPFLAFVLAGVLGASLASLAGSAAAFAAMVAPVLVAFELLLLPGASSPHDWAMVAAAPLYALVLVAASARLAQRVRSTLRLQLEQGRLVEDLAAARDAAVAAAAARAEFLAVMSHEIRTPLAGVAGLNALLLASPLSGEQREYARGIQQSAEALLELVNDVLDVSKVDAGRIELDPRDFAPREELETVARLMRFRAQEKGLDLRCILGAGVPARARGDWPRLRQVLVNLLGNAVKFTPAGSVALVVDGTPGPAGGSTLEVQVVDTGIGIAAGSQDRLFQPFSQAEASTARRFGGTGLGLYVSRRLVEALGGTLTVKSAPGEGSTFRFAVALEPAAAAATEAAGAAALAPPAAVTLPPSRPPPAAHALPPPPPAGLTLSLAAPPPAALTLPPPRPPLAAEVLLVEDNETNLLVARRLLERAGHRVSAARTGREALRSLSGTRFDVVLMDLHLPELDGWAATRQLRTDASGPNQRVPVIALTASASPEDQQACLAAGFSDYLSKPVAPEVLCAAVQRWAAPPPLTSPAPAARPPPAG